MGDLVRIGEFRELGGGDGAPSIRDSVGALDAPDRHLVAAYLRSGVALSAVMGFDRDVLDGSVATETSSLMTDDVFLWRRDLAHYVEKYGVALPLAFVEHARQHIADTRVEVLLACGDERQHCWLDRTDPLQAGMHVSLSDSDEPQKMWTIMRVFGSDGSRAVEA